MFNSSNIQPLTIAKSSHIHVATAQCYKMSELRNDFWGVERTSSSSRRVFVLPACLIAVIYRIKKSQLFDKTMRKSANIQ